MKKRLLSSALVLILLITSSGGAFPACADFMLQCSAAFEETLTSDASPTAGTGNFEEQVSTLMEAYPCDGAYSKIVIDIESNTLQKDGEDAVSLDRYGIDLSQTDSPEMLIPAVPVLEAAGYDAELDEEKGEIAVTDEEGEKTLSPYEDVLENAENIGECENGFVTVSDNETSTKVPVGYLSGQQASDEFSLDTEYTDGKIIVTNRFQTRRLIVGVKNGRIKNTYSAAECIFDGDNRYVLQYDSENAAKEAYEQFENDRNIEYVCCDEVVASCAVSDRTGAEMIQSDRYKKYLAGNQKTTALTVAVVDTGADTAHELLKGRIVKSYNVIKKSTNVSDGNGHGTHVCGIVADNTPKNVKIMPVKVLADNGSGTDLQVSLGIDYAVKNGAKVINMSLGGLCSDPKCPIAVSVKKAIAAGVTVVVAAGNDTQDTKRYCPAGITDCITVSAYSQSGGTASFSNYGSAVDLCAPGDRIESSVPGNGYEILSGTSMASPFAAAAAAMLIINQPALKPAQVEAKLKTYCADMYTKGWDKYSGVGVINLGIALGDNRKANYLLMNNETVQINFFSKASWFYRPAKSTYIESDRETAVLTDYSVTAKSSDPTVAVFDGCYVIAKKPGKTTITVYPSGNGSPVSFDVVIRKIEVWIDYAAKAYDGGNGSAKSPYLISTPEQLAKFALDVRRGVSFSGKYVRLTKDIDLAGKMWISAVYVTYFDSLLPGYAGAQPFSGHFDGGNHKIKNMTVFDDPLRTAWGEEHAVNELWYCFNDGFFSFVSGSSNDPCTIRNLGIENAYVSVSNSGILCGNLHQNTAVSNCYTTGFSVGNGLFGSVCNYNIRISNCYSSATVLQNGISDWIYSSRTSGKVIFNNVFFCGEQLYSEAYTQSGAFCKTIESDDVCRYTELYNCFSAVKSVNNIGFADSSISSKLYNCYYLSGNADSIVNKKGNNAISLKAKTGDFFKTKDSYTTAANWNGNYPWDFKNTWAIDPKINGGYPYLKNNRPNKTAALHTGTWLDKASDSFSGGNGSASSPFRIANAAELARMAKLLRYGGGKGVYFKLTADIDLKGNLWYPIGGGEYYNWKDGDKKGRNSASFSLDGSGKTIRNMTIPSEGDCVGFICKAYGTEIKNLHFRDASVTGRNNVGILCAESAGNTVIANCSVSGKVSGNEAVGGICAQNTAGSRIVATASAAEISANSICAGIAADNGSVIERSRFYGKGSCPEGFYGISSVSCGLIQNCYSIGADLAQYGEIVTSYSVKDGKGQIYGSLGKHSAAKQAEASALKNQASFYKWDFESVWTIDSRKNGGYPTLRPYAYVSETLPADKWENHCASSFAGGNGSKYSPYLIATAGQLAFIKPYLLSHAIEKPIYFRLIANIDLGGKIWNSEMDSSFYLFPFYFDGNNKTVSNMICDNGAGLFDIDSTGSIQNLNVTNIGGRTECGLIASNSGKISNCYVSGKITPTMYSIDGSLNLSDVGGICATNSGIIEKCGFNGTIYGYRNAGGITGYSIGTIRNCYSRGLIVSPSFESAVCSNNHTPEQTKYCYSAAVTTDGQYNITADMKTKAYYRGWDFTNTWDIDASRNGGYPFLRRPASKKILYNTNGGKMPRYYEATYIPGIARNITATPVKTNAYFEGWYADKALTKKITRIDASASSDISLYAKWSPAYYYIRYDGNEASGGSVKTQKVGRDDTVKLAMNGFKAPPGRVFAGWSTTSDNNDHIAFRQGQKVKTLTTKNKATVTLYALWTTTKAYKLTLITNGGKLPSNSPKTYRSSVGCTLPIPTRTGYTFSGWYTNKGLTQGKTTVLNPWDAGDKTFYAKWTPNTYSVRFNANGGSGTMKTQTGFVYGVAARLSANTFTAPSGKVFAGWAVSNSSQAVYVNRQAVKSLTAKNGGTVTLYAVWITPKAYKITYKPNGGTLPSSSSSVYRSGTGCTLPVPTRSGYTFSGWYTDSKLVKGKTDSLKPWDAGNKVFYAKWTKK